MSKLAKALTAAAGNAGGDNLYVEDVFSTYLYTGTDAAQTITNGIDLSGEGGLVWVKPRSVSGRHVLTDTENGTGTFRDTADTSGGFTSSAYITAFNSDGYSIGTGVSSLPATYASWTFRKAEKFFDVVTYTGNGASSHLISHNLGATPAFMVMKRIDSTSGWMTAASDGAGNYKAAFNLNSTAQSYVTTPISTVSTDSTVDVGYWNPNWDGAANLSGATYVLYLFASDAGGFGDDGSENIIKCGSYTTDGSASAQHIDLGFEPQFFIKKKVTSADNWEMYDTMRGWSAPNDTYGVSSAVRLYANLNVAEGATTSSPGPTATGMYFPDGGQSTNATYIYIAIRRPMKTPESGTEVFNFISRTGTGSAVSVSSPILTDALLSIRPSNVNAKYFFDRPRGGSNYLDTTSTSAEGSSSNAITEFGNDYIKLGGGLGATNGNGSNYLYYLFQRATGFFDVVAYTGNGTAGRTVAHNLGVAPELMIFKNRSQNGDNWVVYSDVFSPANYLKLNNDSYAVPDSANLRFNNTAPTKSVFTVGTSIETNWNGQNYISYHFATLAGVSKVGSYTGTGSNIDVDCGFSAGARFILIKRSDSGGTGDWYVWDSVRGITAGNDPYLLLNTTAAEVTSTDYIDPLSSGFTVTSSAPAALNASGGTYLFMAIS
jgi:hypothetical protein